MGGGGCGGLEGKWWGEVGECENQNVGSINNDEGFSGS